MKSWRTEDTFNFLDKIAKYHIIHVWIKVYLSPLSVLSKLKRPGQKRLSFSSSRLHHKTQFFWSQIDKIGWVQPKSSSLVHNNIIFVPKRTLQSPQFYIHLVYKCIYLITKKFNPRLDCLYFLGSGVKKKEI